MSTKQNLDQWIEALEEIAGAYNQTQHALLRDKPLDLKKVEEALLAQGKLIARIQNMRTDALIEASNAGRDSANKHLLEFESKLVGAIVSEIEKIYGFQQLNTQQLRETKALFGE